MRVAPSVLPVALLVPVMVATACSEEVELGKRVCGAGAEICGDGLDNDCDGIVDEPTCYLAAPVGAASWGDYAAGLDVPSCPPGFDLIVDTLDDEALADPGLMDPAGAGETLSLREAMTIADNRPGQTNIRFDAAVFPKASPRNLTMQCIADGLPDVGRLAASDVCMDGRDRGVVIEWPETCPLVGGFELENALVTGITFLNLHQVLTFGGGQIAGCRFNTDGRVLGDPDIRNRLWLTFSPEPTLVGPGNVFVQRAGINVYQADNAQIFENWFGIDPVTRNVFGARTALEFDVGNTAVSIDRNVFLLDGSLIRNARADTVATFRQNLVGVDETGAPVAGTWNGLGSFTSGTFVIGPENTIRGVGDAIVVTGGNVQITRNAIYENNAAIVFSAGDPPVPAPEIESTTASAVSGTCAGPGTVEVFSDMASQAEVFLGEGPCEGGRFSATALPAPHPYVVATFTDTLGRTSALSDPLPAL